MSKVRIHIQRPTLRQWLITRVYNWLLWYAEKLFSEDPARLASEQKQLINDFNEVV